jgi:hypothetical protein
MTTITIDEHIDLERNHFESVEEFQMYLLQWKQMSELSAEHKTILDNRLTDAEENPDSCLSMEELRQSIRRK